MTSIIVLGLIILIIYMFHQSESNKQSDERQKTRALMEEENPFIVLSYYFISDSSGGRTYYKTFEEAKEKALANVTHIEFGITTRYEKTEIWNEGKIIEIFCTKNRLSLDRIDGFSFGLYKGEIKPNDYEPFDLSRIKGLRSIKLKLTNGDVVSLTDPVYSLQFNYLSAHLGIKFYPDDRIKSSNFKVIPIRVIDKIIE